MLKKQRLYKIKKIEIGEHMNLREYLFHNRLSVKKFSEILDSSRNYISQVVNERVVPSKKLARNIEKATNGQVTSKELLKHKD